jgi:SAM-dependent methyltransferase
LNIEFARADILSWPDPDRRFRVIVCSGVLHHLGDPLAGWRALLRVLHPDGSMKIGLYSRVARQDVARLRETLGSARPRTPAALRAARARLIEVHWASLGPQFQTSTDLFSSSGCRDLFFHEQEHQFTIPKNRASLNGLELTFHGFVLPRLIRESFQRWAPPGTSMIDLNAWWDYEQAHPQSFSGMYQFWCRRRA